MFLDGLMSNYVEAEPQKWILQKGTLFGLSEWLAADRRNFCATSVQLLPNANGPKRCQCYQPNKGHF